MLFDQRHSGIALVSDCHDKKLNMVLTVRLARSHACEMVTRAE